MALDLFPDDAPRLVSTSHEIGQDLSSLSLFELEERIIILRQEIMRLEQAISEKKSTQAAADAFFKK